MSSGDVPDWLRQALRAHDPQVLARFESWRAARHDTDSAGESVHAAEDRALAAFAAATAQSCFGALLKLEAAFEVEERVEQALDPTNRLVEPRLLLGVLLDLRRIAGAALPDAGTP